MMRYCVQLEFRQRLRTKLIQLFVTVDRPDRQSIPIQTHCSRFARETKGAGIDHYPIVDRPYARSMCVAEDREAGLRRVLLDEGSNEFGKDSPVMKNLQDRPRT